MKRLLNSFALKCAASAAVISAGWLASSGSVLAEDPVEQKVIVFTSDDDDEDDAREETHEIVTEVKAPKLWLGIMLKDVEGDLARYLDFDEGILVDSVVEDSPAAKAGIQVGDILLRVGETKLTQPQDLLKVMSALGEEGESLEIHLLRKGEKKRVQVVPAARPELEEVVIDELKDLHFYLEDADEAGEAVKKALRKLRVGDLAEDVNILRLGNPSMILRGHGKTAPLEGDLEAVIVREVDGDKIEVKVVRKDDQPATITVTKDGEVTEYEGDNLDEMPEEISVIVKPMIDGKKGLHIGAHVEVVRPEWTDFELGKLDHQEIVKKARAMAEKSRALAAESVEKARLGARLRSAGESEVQELKAMVEDLRKEIAKLREELNDKE